MNTRCFDRRVFASIRWFRAVVAGRRLPLELLCDAGPDEGCAEDEEVAAGDPDADDDRGTV